MSTSPDALARLLLDQHRADARYVPVAAAHGIADLHAAYAVQRAFVAAMMDGRGDPPAGYKIGLTSKRMQEMCGIGSPVAGVVLPGRVHRSGVTLARGDYGRLGVEFEIGVRLAQDVPRRASPYDVVTIAPYVGQVCAAVEIVDDRNADYKELEALSLICDNAWNAGIVLGEAQDTWPDLTEVTGTVVWDGKEIDSGHGRDALGHPFVPLAWLASHLADSGSGLRKGDWVLTGSIVTTRFPTAPARVRFEVSGLGAVDLALTD
jgi:2-keto-4-pentenoate hydratase